MTVTVTAVDTVAGGKGEDATEPAVSLQSFVWAHCLVSSRALDLVTRNEGVDSGGSAAVPANAAGRGQAYEAAHGVRRVQCMLPGRTTSLASLYCCEFLTDSVDGERCHDAVSSHAGIDFANHAPGGSCVLSLRQTADGKRCMPLIHTRPHWLTCETWRMALAAPV